MVSMVNGVCPKCKKEVRVDERNVSAFCTLCGEKLIISHAIALYEHMKSNKEIVPSPNTDDLSEHSEQSSDSEEAGGDVREAISAERRWALILEATDDLKPRTIKHLGDFAYAEASSLFSETNNKEVKNSWREVYFEALEASLKTSIEEFDLRTFLETKIYQWFSRNNAFLYPVAKDFDITNILDKEFMNDWNEIIAALPEERQEEVSEACKNLCRRIREYYISGFNNVKEAQNGDLSRLMGSWRVKKASDEIKDEILMFSQSAANIPHLETCRVTVNSYNYFRGIALDHAGIVVADEHRKFPSASGLGGDFFKGGDAASELKLMAVYEYLLVMPNAIFIRAPDPSKVPGYPKIAAYIEKCRLIPCFLRENNIGSAKQMRPISQNHDTNEPSKRQGSCYIATAVYGDINAPEVEALRRFRDRRLNTNKLGRRLCLLYYKISPALSEKIKSTSLAGRAIRRFLDYIVSKMTEELPK